MVPYQHHLLLMLAPLVAGVATQQGGGGGCQELELHEADASTSENGHGPAKALPGKPGAYMSMVGKWPWWQARIGSCPVSSVRVHLGGEEEPPEVGDL